MFDNHKEFKIIYNLVIMKNIEKVCNECFRSSIMRTENVALMNLVMFLAFPNN